MKNRIFIVVFSAMLGLLMNPVLLYAEFYKWIDDQGNSHFTDQYSNIPDKYRPFVETRKTPIEISFPSIKNEPSPQFTLESPKPVEQEMLSVFRGRISGIDRAERTIAVMGVLKTMVFPVPQDTKITTDFGKHMLFADLRTEMWVSVEHVQKGEDIRTLNIKIEATSSSYQNERREEQKEKYEGPKYESPGFQDVGYRGPDYEEAKYEVPKYKGLKYTGPKNKAPTYKAPKK